MDLHLPHLVATDHVLPGHVEGVLGVPEPRVPVVDVDQPDPDPGGVVVPAVTGRHAELVALPRLEVHSLPQYQLAPAAHTELSARQLVLTDAELHGPVGAVTRHPGQAEHHAVEGSVLQDLRRVQPREEAEAGGEPPAPRHRQGGHTVPVENKESQLIDGTFR